MLSLKQTGFQKWGKNIHQLSAWIYGFRNKMGINSKPHIAVNIM